MAVDAQGQLWVAEADMSPKRFSVWDTKTGKLVKEFFGPSTYGALGGAINPLDPNLMVGQGCEWRLDPQTGRAACLGVITRDGMENSRFGIGSNGRLYWPSPTTGPSISAPSNIFERLGDADYRAPHDDLLRRQGRERTSRRPPTARRARRPNDRLGRRERRRPAPAATR